MFKDVQRKFIETHTHNAHIDTDKHTDAHARTRAHTQTPLPPKNGNNTWNKYQAMTCVPVLVIYYHLPGTDGRTKIHIHMTSSKPPYPHCLNGKWHILKLDEA